MALPTPEQVRYEVLKKVEYMLVEDTESPLYADWNRESDSITVEASNSEGRPVKMGTVTWTPAGQDDLLRKLERLVEKADEHGFTVRSRACEKAEKLMGFCPICKLNEILNAEYGTQ